MMSCFYPRNNKVFFGQRGKEVLGARDILGADKWRRGSDTCTYLVGFVKDIKWNMVL